MPDQELLPEWEFRFDLLGGESESSNFPEPLLDAAVAWAEERDLGIGGGFSSLGGLDRIWRFRFGLCVTMEECLIPKSQARRLYSRLQRFAWKRGLMIQGGFGPFDGVELPPDWDEQLGRLLDVEPVDWRAIRELFTNDPNRRAT